MQEPAVRPLLLLLRCATGPETPRRGRRRRAAHLPGRRRRRDGRCAGLRQALRRAELDAGGRRASGPLLVEALDDPSGAGLARPVGHPAGRRGRRRCSRSPATRSPRRGPPPRTCCGRCGSAPDSRPGGSARAARAVRRERPPTVTSTPWSRCSTPPPGSATGCPAPAPRSSSTTCSASRSPATSPRCARSPTRPSRCSPRTPSKGLEWDVVCVAGVQEGIWPDLRMRGSFLGSERLVDLLRPGARAGGHRGRDRDDAGPAARGGAPAVLRRRHPGPPRACSSPPSPASARR